MDKRTYIVIFLTTVLLFGSACSRSSPSENPIYTISGTISVDTNSHTDSDIRDTYAPYRYHTDNNIPDYAQQIAKPAKVGGYSDLTTDANDYYKVSLNNGDVIRLYVASGTADLDLYLYDVSDTVTPVTFSSGLGSPKSIIAPVTSEYYIEVRAAANGSNYLLTVGNVSIGGFSAQQTTVVDFVPGELLVRFKADQTMRQSMFQTSDRFFRETGMQLKSHAISSTNLVGFDNQRDQVFKQLGISGNRDKKALGISATEAQKKSALKQDTLAVLETLRQRDDVASVDLNYLRKPMGIPTDPLYNRLWNYHSINMPRVWEEGLITGSGTIVAVIDTGVKLDHPDLAGQLVSGYDFISYIPNAIDGDGIDPNPDDPGDGFGTFYPSTFHGTHVAGTIAAKANNGIGIVGVAHGAKIMPLRVLGSLGGSDYDIIQAMYYAAGLQNDSGTYPSQKADVINMSLGGPGYSSTFEMAVSTVYNAGTIIVAAAGNENTSSLMYPASYPGVVSVSAVDLAKVRAPYSNFGSEIDVAAPGGNTGANLDRDDYPDGILSTIADDRYGYPVNTYGYYQGTSMATPHVAAVAALMKQADPAMTPTQFESHLNLGSITDDLGSTGWDSYFGEGLINAVKAINTANATHTFPAKLHVTTSELDFNSQVTARAINVENSGNVGDFTGTNNVIFNIAYSQGSGWLTVDDSVSDITTKLGSYRFNVSRHNLADGTYNATVTFSSPESISDVVVNVTMQVGFSGKGDAGYHYVLLYDDYGVKKGEIEVGPYNGYYNYSFSGLSEGNYRIIAGTDMDNDGFICDSGEACGRYINNSIFSVSSNLSNLNFTTGFVLP
ncbi:MAG: S8 family serine peptidase [Gammaproteobacteria bacterium]|nr:S8 family serine peptidase [Gammaproteobacteria bacterium]